VSLTKSEWKTFREEFVDDIERELGATAPADSLAALNAFRKRLDEDLDSRRRKRFDRDLDAFIESKPYLKVAVTRHLRRQIRPAVKAAMVALEEAKVVLAKYRKKKRVETA
jgi:hypothetical protein